MTHDRLCSFAPCDCYKDGSGLHSCGTNACQCEFIAKVRADTLRMALAAVRDVTDSYANQERAAETDATWKCEQAIHALIGES